MGESRPVTALTSGSSRPSRPATAEAGGYVGEHNLLQDEDHLIECDNILVSVIKKQDLPQLQGICQRNEHKEGLELRDQRGWSPVFNSVVFNDIPCFKQMVRVGATIDGVDKEGMSLMHLAPIHGDAALVKMLADNGCESNSESSLHHFFPLHIAAMTIPFPSSGAKPDIKADSDPVVAAVVSSGADANACTQEGWTPLHFAVAAGNPEAVRSLVLEGASIDTPNGMGLTPLQLAICYDVADLADIMNAAAKQRERNLKKARLAKLKAGGPRGM